jgi:hypothetical protein
MTIAEIKCTDWNEKLNLYNYTYCDNDSSPETKECRGIVKDKDGAIVVSTFGYTDEYTTADSEKFAARIGNIEEWSINYSMEGTLIRVFWYGDEWYISTHKKLNAFKSRWSCRDTFGEIFRKGLYEMFGSEAQTDDVLAEFNSTLDKTRTHLFLLRNNHENRIVCQAHFVRNHEAIMFVGYFDAEKKFVRNEGGHDGWLGRMISPTPVETSLLTVDDILGFVDRLNYNEYQGIIFFNKHSNDQFKLVNNKYHELYLLRDNNPNLRFRYLELRCDPEKVKQLYMLYPRSADMFDEYENVLYRVARMIYHFYVNRYIKNRYITLPREEYTIMKKCHDWYLMDRQNNRIFTNKIMEFIGQEPSLNLYKMIRRFMTNDTRRFSYGDQPHV